MDIKVFEQYGAIKNEIRLLKNRIIKIDEKETQYVSDVVKGSSSEFPYNKRTFTVSGYDTAYDKIGRLEGRIINLERKLEAIESLVDTIGDSEIRQIIRLKYFEGKTWRKIGREMNYSKSGVYEKYIRFIEKSGQKGQIV